MQKRENNQAKDARSAALTVLLRCERNGAWLDGALKSVLKESALEPRDAALCSKLCYGVCQNRLLLEFWLSKFSKVKPEKLEPAVRIALPNLGNNFIDLIKGTSLVSVISMVDLFQTGKQIASRTFEPLAMYSEVAIIYLVIFTLLTAAQSALEKYSNRYVRSRNA